MSLQKRRSNPIIYDGIELRWSVSVRTLSSPGEGLLVVQSDRGQRLVVRLALNDLWIHGPGSRHAVKPSLVRRVLEEACGLGWTPDAPGPEFNATLNENDCLSRA